jgi:prophage regulatory protein
MCARKLFNVQGGAAMYTEASGEDAGGGGLNDVRILRFPEVVSNTGMSKSAIYGRIRSQQFPSPVLIGPRTVGFIEHEIDGWIKQLISSNRAVVRIS